MRLRLKCFCLSPRPRSLERERDRFWLWWSWYRRSTAPMKRPRATRSLFRCPQCRPPRAADEPSASGGVSASSLPGRDAGAAGWRSGWTISSNKAGYRAGPGRSGQPDSNLTRPVPSAPYSSAQTLDRDPIKLNRITVSFFGWSMIFSENRCPPSDQVRGQAFSGSCSSSSRPAELRWCSAPAWPRKRAARSGC